MSGTANVNELQTWRGEESVTSIIISLELNESKSQETKSRKYLLSAYFQSRWLLHNKLGVKIESPRFTRKFLEHPGEIYDRYFHAEAQQAEQKSESAAVCHVTPRFHT